jgi:tetratricopeptide (TPR) repeat protein
MKYYHEENILKKLILKFSDMSQTGTVCFFEKTALLDLILFFENDDNIEKAIEVCDFGRVQYVSSIEFLFHKSRLLVELEELDEALIYLEKGLAYSPGNFDLNLLQAEVWIEFGEFKLAYDILKNLYQSSGNAEQSQVLFLLAKIHEINGDFKKMFSVLKKALQKDPNHPILLNKIWLAVEMAGLYEESVELHLAIIEDHPYSYLAWYNLGQAYYCLEDYETAAEAFEYSFIINSKFSIAYKDGAESYIMAENYEKALNMYQEFLETSPGDSDVYAKIGFCYEHLGEVLVAKNYYLKAIETNAANSMALFRMGECHMFEEKWDDAIHYYNQAIEADCDREEYLIAIAEAYFKNKNAHQAKIFFQKATDMAPELGKYWTQYATFLMKMGDSEEAFLILDEAQIYTVDTELLYCKVACLFAMSKRKEALQTLTQALEENASLLESLFKLTPELKQDSEVRALINTFKM